MIPVPIALHAERVAGDPAAVRWVVPAGSVPPGRISRAPGRLGAMFDDDTLTRGVAEHTAVWLWLRPDLSWAQAGATVQSALREALADPGGWAVDTAPGEVLELVTDDLLAGSVGDFIRSHGGSVRAARLDGDTVAIRLGGACEHCAAAEQTLRVRLLTGLRQRCPDLVEVNTDRRQSGLVLRLQD